MLMAPIVCITTHLLSKIRQSCEATNGRRICVCLLADNGRHYGRQSGTGSALASLFCFLAVDAILFPVGCAGFNAESTKRLIFRQCAAQIHRVNPCSPRTVALQSNCTNCIHLGLIHFQFGFNSSIMILYLSVSHLSAPACVC